MNINIGIGISSSSFSSGVVVSTLVFEVRDQFVDEVEDSEVRIISDSDLVYTLVTDHSGRVVFEKLPLGVYTYEVSKDGYVTDTGEIEFKGITLIHSTIYEMVSNLVFEVRDQFVNVVEDSEVLVTSGDLLYTLVTDHTGIVVFSKLPLGIYTYEVVKDGYISDTGEVEVKFESEGFLVVESMVSRLEMEFNLEEGLDTNVSVDSMIWEDMRYTVYLTFTDYDTGDIVQGVKVTVSDTGREILAGQDGVVYVPDVLGNVQFSYFVEHEEYEDQVYYIMVSGQDGQLLKVSELTLPIQKNVQFDSLLGEGLDTNVSISSIEWVEV